MRTPIEQLESRLMLSAGSVQTIVTVPATAGPWIPISSDEYGVGDESSPVIVDLASNSLPTSAGSSIQIEYQSGSVTAGPGWPAVDADGDTDYPANANDGSSGNPFPSAFFDASEYPTYLTELVGVFTDSNGDFAGAPFTIGDSKTVEVPQGATQLQLGVNDDIYYDNAGSWNVAISPAGDGLQFVSQPTDTDARTNIKPAVSVELLDSNGDLVTSSNSEVTLTLADGSSGAVLGGRTTAKLKDGIATFSDLKIDTVGNYTLEASDKADRDATSDSFDILKVIKVKTDLKTLTAPWTSFANDLAQSWDAIGQILEASPGFTIYPPTLGKIDINGEIAGQISVNEDGDVVKGSLGIEGAIGDDVTAEAYWGLPAKLFGFGLSGKLEVRSSIGAEVKWEDGDSEYSGGVKDSGAMTIGGHAYALFYKGTLSGTAGLEIPTTLSSDGEITSNFNATGNLAATIEYRGLKGEKYTTVASISREWGPDNLLTYSTPLSQIVDSVVTTIESRIGIG